jgi:hypothetical protein
MRALLGIAAASLAATAVPAGPAAAQDKGGPFVSIPSPIIDSGTGWDTPRDRDRRRLRGTDTVLVYDRDYQGDTAWRPESFNDWWHERPNRSYPAWVQRNRDCQRMWWSGETLRC